MHIFCSRDKQYKSKLSPITIGEGLNLSIILHDGYYPCNVHLVIRRDGCDAQYIEMYPSERNHDCYTKYSVTYSTDTAGLYWYHFEFDGNFKRNRVYNVGYSVGEVTDNGSEYQLTVYDTDYKTPDEFKQGVFYQIFPDRFHNSGKEKGELPYGRYLVTDWSEKPVWKQDKVFPEIGQDYFGGDLKGIEQKLPYLKSLGVTIIYLNPIFEAHSNHRYNTADYFKIDPSLGTEDDFVSLCKTAKKMGIKIILDGVFSHTGDDSIYFNRYGRYGNSGAYNDRNSEYFSWFNFIHWPEKCHSWWGVKTLPELNETVPSYMDFICGENGVLRYWMKRGASGWRLDVADELPDAFLDQIRRTIKSENPDALLIGEVWEDASNKISGGGRRRFLLGNQLDSVMNYPFRSAIIDFVSGGDGHDFTDSILTVIENYPKPSLDTLMNNVGTHDTERIITALGAENMPSTRPEQSKFVMTDEMLERGRKLSKIAAVLQYTLPGIPCLYYGDEAGMYGCRDPFNRATYPWGNEDTELVEFYKKLGLLRAENIAFNGGEFNVTVSGLGYVIYTRENDDNKVLVAVNRWREEEKFELPDEWKNADVFMGEVMDNQLIIKPFGAAILIKK